MKEENTKNPKLILIYGLIMLVCVVVVVVIGLATGPKNIVSENKESQTLIDEKQNSIRLLEEKVLALESEVEELKLEKNRYIAQVDTLEKELAKMSPTNSADEKNELTTLVEIYEKFKAGEVDAAKEAFEQVEAESLDEATLAYYQILKDFLEEN